MKKIRHQKNVYDMIHLYKCYKYTNKTLFFRDHTALIKRHLLMVNI